MVSGLFSILCCLCGALFAPTNGDVVMMRLADTAHGSAAAQPTILNSSSVVHSNTSLSQSSTVAQSSSISTVSFNTDTAISTLSPLSSSPSDLALSTISNINADSSSTTSSSLNPSTDDSGSIICHGLYVCNKNEVCSSSSNAECLCKENYHRINNKCQPKLSTLSTTSLPRSSSLPDLSPSTTLKIVEDNATSTTTSASLPEYTGKAIPCTFFTCKENEICDRFNSECKCKENYHKVDGICQPSEDSRGVIAYGVGFSCAVMALAIPIAFIVIRIKRMKEHRHQLLSSKDTVSV